MGQLRRYDLAHMLSTEPPAVPWVVEPLAAVGEVTVLYGAPGVGKSLLCLGLADAVSRRLGRTAGLRCRRARVAYIDAENGEWETHRRVQAVDCDPERLAIYDALGVHLVDDYAEIEAAIREHKPRLVILDSLRRLLPGVEENDSGAMADALGACKMLAQRCRTAVVVIHHEKKEGGRYRGSSAIADQASIIYRFKRAKGDLDRTRRVLDNEKMRIAAEPFPRFLRVGIAGGQLFLDRASKPDDDELVSGPAQGELAPLVLAELESGPATRSQVAKALGRERNDGTVRRTFEALKASGQIQKDGDSGLWQPVASVASPSSSPDGNVANSVASGNKTATDHGNTSVAKSGRAKRRQHGDGDASQESGRADRARKRRRT